eukprot:3392356-Pyramimonas_sp.AAC.1
MSKWGVQPLLIDANARLGSTPISQVGQAGFVQGPSRGAFASDIRRKRHVGSQYSSRTAR